jgi:hypothetical protein
MLNRSASVPFLPGQQVKPELAAAAGHSSRRNFQRPQTLIYKLDSPADVAVGKVSVDPQLLRSMSEKASLTLTGGGKSAAPPTAPAEKSNRPAIAIQPAWLKHDKQALRFYAYYQEPVVENYSENFRIRNVVFTFFLEDGTMQITEPKVENSGIWPQGPFVKRHKIPKGDGSFFTPMDLKMGIDITIYARTFHIVSCDEFTKWFYGQAGMDVGVDEDTPLDNFLENQVFKKVNQKHLTGLPKSVMEQKEYNELRMGGSRKNHKMDQFLQNDRKVLRFYAYWDDPTRYGARQYFVMHYYLADDSVEINNNYMRNSGRWETPVFFTRKKLELQPTYTHTPGMYKPESPLLKPSDIEVGKSIPVYGREFFIYDADDATKEFYEKFMGKHIEPIVVPEPEKVHMQLLYPPHNGMGGDEDSLGSCIALRPKPPKKDLVKMMTNDGKILRFECIAQNNVPEDMHRKFIIEVYLSDDSITVGEVKQRNSGCWEGKFRKRGLTVNPATGVNFTPADFFVGAEITISAMPMMVVRTDEYSLKFMEMNPTMFPQSSFPLLCLKLSPLLSADSPPSGFMTPEDFRESVAGAIGIVLSDQELITLLRNVSKPDSADIDVAALMAKIKSA